MTAPLPPQTSDRSTSEHPDISCGLVSRSGAPIPLEHVAIRGEVLGGDARVRVAQRYRNTEREPIEAVYTFPLPSGATLVAFSMTSAGRRVEGVVKEREEAFRAYDEAITSGHGAALVDQERPNVFTAQVGNLLPGEETEVELEYLERLRADEGALRFMVPTLVAPRYVPGTPAGDRSAHGLAEPTDRVPDADRVSPPRAARVPYTLSVDVAFDLGVDVEVESPSHAITVKRDGKVTRVSLLNANGGTALDRDLVLVARGAMDAPLQTLVTHAEPGIPGYFALTVVPDLYDGAKAEARTDVVFLIDVSGSMAGTSIDEARAALRLCLRHLREGDRFNVIAFNDRFTTFAPEPVTFTQATLERADGYVSSLDAGGGTELLEPLVAAIRAVPEGVVVLLTDGQVANEDEILGASLAARKTARVFSFGIGTSVSDALLRDLGRRTAGAVELIHPGERIDEKVIAVFARAIAARVTDVSIAFEGVNASELAPAELSTRPLVDGEPWTLVGRYDAPGVGCAHLRGTLRGEKWHARIPLDFLPVSRHEAIAKLWARERIRDLEDSLTGATEGGDGRLEGRRAEAMKARIVDLAVKHGLSTRYTSFVVVETREGDRRTSKQPATRVVPVNLPAGWAMFGAAPASAAGRGGMGSAGGFNVRQSTMVRGGAPRAKMAVMARAAAPMRMPAPAPAALPAEMPMPKPAAQPAQGAIGRASLAEKAKAASDPIVTLLERQLASGLFPGDEPKDDPELASLRATTRALFELVRAGVTTAHAVHGEQVRRIVVALAVLAQKLGARDAAWVELALGVAALAASGRRTRRQVVDTASLVALGLAAHLGDESALRTHVDAMAEKLAGWAAARGR